MTAKPIIIHIEDDSGCEDHNNFRDALIAVLEKDCGCRVANYPYLERLREDESKIKLAIKDGSVLLFIFAQEAYPGDGYLEAIPYLRSLAPKLPIIVIPSNGDAAFAADPSDPLIRAMSHFDRELVDYVKYLRAEWSRNANWLRPGNETEAQIIAGQLVEAHRANNPSETSLGEEDDNQRLVAEALRMRLLGSGLSEIEFDNTLDRTKTTFPVFEPGAYQAEVEHFRGLTPGELADVDEFLMSSVGAGENHGVCNSNACGFAIDPVTQETHTTRGAGNHRVAGQVLSFRLEAMGMIRREPLADEMQYKWRLIEGRIVRDVPGFKIPILVLWQGRADAETFRKTAAFLMSKRQFIPVSSYMKLVE